MTIYIPRSSLGEKKIYVAWITSSKYELLDPCQANQAFTFQVIFLVKLNYSRWK